MIKRDLFDARRVINPVQTNRLCFYYKFRKKGKFITNKIGLFKRSYTNFTKILFILNRIIFTQFFD